MARKKEPRFSKEQLKDCALFAGQRDLLEGLLGEGERYTKAEAQKRIDTFLKGQVKE